jgi:hypothetical protein
MNPIPNYTKCPKCGALYSYSDSLQENISRTEFWSDGFCMAPMKKDIINFAKCYECNTFFWIQENSIHELENLPEIKSLENSWSLDNISSKEIDFIKDAFRSGLASNTEKEIFLRIKLWHAINHLIRKYDSHGFFKIIKQKFFETADSKDSLKHYNSTTTLKLNNLIRLANLLKLDMNENSDYLLFAEIYRELGDFSKAMIFCHKAETSSKVDSNRIELLKEHLKIKSKMPYRL